MGLGIILILSGYYDFVFLVFNDVSGYAMP
jgi:hypothetical protein